MKKNFLASIIFVLFLPSCSLINGFKRKASNSSSQTIEKNSTESSSLTSSSSSSSSSIIEETFTVRWLNYDGALLEIDTNVPYGTNPSFDSSTPIRPRSGEYLYTFAGWNPELSPVISDISYTAVFYAEIFSSKTYYGTKHDGTIDDPFSNEDAILVTRSNKYMKESYYVKGIVDSFYYAPNSKISGAVSWHLKPEQENGEQFDAFDAFKNGNNAITDDDIWVGGETLFYGSFSIYKGKCECKDAILIECTGIKTYRETHDVTVAEAIAIGNSLDNNEVDWDYYNVTGYVVAKSTSNMNYYLSDNINTDIIHPSSLLMLYNSYTDASSLLRRAKVTVTISIKNYNGQIENANEIRKDSTIVLSEGSKWTSFPLIENQSYINTYKMHVVFDHRQFFTPAEVEDPIKPYDYSVEILEMRWWVRDPSIIDTSSFNYLTCTFHKDNSIYLCNIDTYFSIEFSNDVDGGDVFIYVKIKFTCQSVTIQTTLCGWLEDGDLTAS